MGEARLQVKVSADAKEASAAFASLAKDIKAVGSESVGVTEGVARVDAALAKLARAPDTPLALAKATAKVKVEIDELRAALEKTPASAEKMKAITAALAQADQAMQHSITRAGKLGEAQEEVKQQMGLTAKGAESLGNSFGSLDGIMGKMADSSSAVSQSVAKFGFSVMAAGQAFEFGYTQGEKFRTLMEEMGVKIPTASDAMADMVVDVDRWTSSVDQSVTTGSVLKDTLFNLVTGTRGLGEAYRNTEGPERSSIARAREMISLREQQAKSERALADAMAKSGLVWKDANAEREAVIAKLNAAELALSRVSSGEQSWGEAVRANTPELQKLREEAEKHGIALEKVAPRTAAAAAESDKYAAAARNAAAATSELAAATTGSEVEWDKVVSTLANVVAAYDKTAAAAARTRAEQSAARNFSSPETDEGLKRIQFDAVGAAAAAGEFGDSLDTVAAKVTSLGGTLTVQKQIWLEVAMASDEATAALYRQVEATRALSDQQKDSLDAVRGWSDYIINLQNGYESGVTSLGSYIQQLVAFKSQLLQMFAGVSGEARKSLEEMIQLIETLMQTAGAGGPTSAAGGYAGQFERDANKGKK